MIVDDEKKIGYILGSVDLCNSTSIKSRFENKTPQYKEELYKTYLQNLYNNELTFYENLLSSYQTYSNSNENILDRLYVLKNIGDEFWFCIEVDADNDLDLANVTVALYDAVKAMRTSWLSISNSLDSELWQDLGGTNLASLNYKAFFDFVEYAVECSQTRYEYFTENIEKLCNNRTGKFSFEERCRLFNRLNICNVISDASKQAVLRTDFIGYQVDCFFRYAKYAVNHMFAIGQRLAERVMENQKNDVCVLTCGDHTRMSSFHYFYWLSKAHKPKGLAYAYKIIYLIEEQALYDLREDIEAYSDAIQDNSDMELKHLVGILQLISLKYKLIS